MRKFSFLFIFLFLTASPGFAQTPAQTITLKDGSTIQGQLIAVSGEEYTIQTASMGQIKVPVSNIAGINLASGNPGYAATTQQSFQQGLNMGLQAGAQPGTSSPGFMGGFNGLQMPNLNSSHLAVMQDPQIMTLIQDAMSDPEIMELLKNPALMQAALSMDAEKMKNNPEVQKLLQNPKMQQIMALTAQKMQASGQLQQNNPQPQQ